MASAASILLNITGSDQVSGMLQGITAKLNGLQKAGASGGSGGGLAALGSKIKSALLPAALVGSAVAGVKAYVGQLKSLSDEYSNLSGRAADAQTTASALLKITGAAKQANLRGASLESISTSLGAMAKNTGNVGTEGLAATLKALANIGDEQERLTRLSEIFGKSGGTMFAPIVAGGDGAVEEFLAVADTVSTVRDSTVAKFADIGTALEQASESMHSTWSEAMVGIVSAVENALGLSTEGTAETIATAVKYVHAGIEAVVKIIIAIPATVFRVGRIIGEFLRNLFVGLYDGIKGLFNGDGFRDAFMDSMRQFVAEASHEIDSIKAQWRGVVDLQALKAGETEGKSLADTFRESTASLGSKLGDKAGEALTDKAATAGKTLHDSIQFSDAIEAGSNAFLTTIAKARMASTGRASTATGTAGTASTATGGGSSASSTITQNSILNVLREILREAQRMNGNLNFATV